jgi:hypothetical protein
MQITMPSGEELAKFTASVFLGLKHEGEPSLDRFRKEEPLLYVLASAQIKAILAGPEEDQREEFLDGLRRIVA